MTNENNLIDLVNNKKPVELVQELKDYEIKTSKLSPAARAKVIKMYGGNYVSEDRESYGPCRRYNSYCNCESDERWADLVVACPAKGCLSTDETPRNWTRKKCGHLVEISNKARIQCTNYGGCRSALHVAY